MQRPPQLQLLFTNLSICFVLFSCYFFIFFIFFFVILLFLFLVCCIHGCSLYVRESDSIPFHFLEIDGQPFLWRLTSWACARLSTGPYMSQSCLSSWSAATEDPPPHQRLRAVCHETAWPLQSASEWLALVLSASRLISPLQPSLKACPSVMNTRLSPVFFPLYGQRHTPQPSVFTSPGGRRLLCACYFVRRHHLVPYMAAGKESYCIEKSTVKSHWANRFIKKLQYNVNVIQYVT